MKNNEYRVNLVSKYVSQLNLSEDIKNYFLERNILVTGGAGAIGSNLVIALSELVGASGIIIVLYGGIIYGIFPEAVEGDISWESHLTGALVGVLLAFFFRKTKIDFDHDGMEEDHPEENHEQNNFHHTGNTDSVEIKYTFKPTDKNK